MFISSKDMAERKFGKLRMKYPKDIMSGSGKKEIWACDCGKETIAAIYSVTSGDVKSCGKCNLITAEEMSIRKFGKLRMKYPKDVMPGSKKKEWWLCDCGRESITTIGQVISGKTTSCGRCSMISAEELSKMKFGKLVMKSPHDLFPHSNKKEWWICDCGNEILATPDQVFSGNTKSCGRCNLITAEEFAKMKFGKLKVEKAFDTKPGSGKKTWWLCDCGGKIFASVYYVMSGQTTRCGKCNTIIAEEMKTRKFGKLKIHKAVDIFPGSIKKERWDCDCGNETDASISEVTHGHTKSCGRCNEISAEEMVIRKFGKLRMKYPRTIKPGSPKKEWWLCDCGNETFTGIHSVTCGDTKSCGNCRQSVSDWYENNKLLIRSLQCPIELGQFPTGGVMPLETIKKMNVPFLACCPACQGMYYPRLMDIKRGVSITCGCSSYKISTGQIRLLKSCR